MKNPIWLDVETVKHFHRQISAAHGTDTGQRDLGQPLKDALLRPQTLNAMRPRTRVFRLAACYGYSIAKIFHPFVDGNKRVGALATFAFLADNGFEVEATDNEVIETFLSVADGSCSEEQLARWLRAHGNPIH